MTAITLTGYIVRETEAAVAFVQQAGVDAAPLWLPRRKIVASKELDTLSAGVQLRGETAKRVGVPVELQVCEEFAKRVGVA
jgi:hypothetical protein